MDETKTSVTHKLARGACSATFLFSSIGRDRMSRNSFGIYFRSALWISIFLLQYIKKRIILNYLIYVEKYRKGAFQSGGGNWHAEERHHHTVERRYWFLSFITTALAILVAFASVIISNQTLTEARKATGFAKEQVGEARSATGEAHRQADEAKRQADAADRGLKEGSQPLIAVSGVRWSAPLVRDTDNGIRVLFSNIGKSAAPFFPVGGLQKIDETSMSIDYDSIDFGENRYCDVATFFKSPTNVAFPSTNFANMNTGIKVDKSVVNQLLDKKQTMLAVQGCIFYKDGESIRYTGYCYVAAQGAKVADPSNSPICDKGNFSH